MNIKQLQKDAWQYSEEQGFHSLESYSFYKQAALIASEVGEMIDAYKKDIRISNHNMPAIPEEMADIMIRLAEMAFNKTRPFLHGGKL